MTLTNIHSPLKHAGSYNFDSLVSNWRLVEFSLSQVKFNAANVSNDEEKLITINFSDYKLPSPRTGELKPLTEFEHVCHCLVFFVADRLIRNTRSSNVKTIIITCFNIVIKFYYFLFLRNKYYLNDATISDTDAFVRDLANGGIHKALKLEKKYRDIQSRIETDESYASAITDIRKNDSVLLISLASKMIQNEIGIAPPKYIAPSYLYESAYRICNPGSKLTIQKGYIVSDELCNLTPLYLQILNNLYLLGNDTDRLMFFPFVETTSTYNELTGKTPGRTENITLEDAVSILGVCNTWIYEYADNLIAFGERCRQKMLELSNLGINRRQIVFSDWINEHWIYSKKNNKLPLHEGKMTSAKFKTFIETLQTACVTLIAINNGRRKNEIIGTDTNFGLYFGCVKTSECGFITNHTIDIYIEKTIKKYCEMSCNTLTRDAVALLEKIYVLLRPIGEKIPNYNNDTEKARKDKLLITKYFSLDGLNRKPSKFRDNNEKYFYSLTKVKNKKLHTRHHPYRRMFAMLYYYRYKMASLPALSQQLKHLNYDMTLVYINDDKTRMSQDRLEKLYKLYKSENGVMDGIISETEHKFLKDIVELTLKGKTAGGFSKRIVRIHKWFLRNAIKVKNSTSYRELDEKQKIEVLTDALEKKGYGAKSRKHGVCGSNNKKGKCFDEADGILKREKGVPTLCVKCPFHVFTNEYLENLKEDKIKLTADKDNYELPKAARSSIAKALENLDRLITLEEKMLSED